MGYTFKMAKNKRDIDPQVKRDEIAAQALGLFLEHGFEATSMAMISRAASIAPNTIYWYFDGKDEVFVAALDKLTNAFLTDLTGKVFESPSHKLTWMLQQADGYQQLITTVHARLTESPAVSEWHDRFHQLLERMLLAELGARGVPVEQAKIMTTVGTFLIEGLLSHPHSSEQRKTVLSWLLELVGEV